MKRVIQSILMVAVLSAIAAAQAPAPTAKMPETSEGNRNMVYGGFVYEPTDWGPAWDKWYGLNFNYTRDVYKHFALVGDFDWIRNNGSNKGDIDHGVAHNADAYGFRAGPRYNVLSKKHRIQPYAEGLFGGAHMSALVPYPGRTSPLVQKTWFGFSWAVGGGVDFRLTNHLGIRGEWLHVRQPWGTEQTDASDWDRISFGASWRW